MPNQLMPSHLNIEVTRACNQACGYCFNDSIRGASHTVFEIHQWRSILASLQLKGLASVHITGGEPFVWRNTPILLEIAQRLGLSTSILSNGTRIRDLVASPTRKTLAALALAQISLDSLDSDVHDRRRGAAGAHATALEAIAALRSVGVRVQISCVFDQENLGELRALEEFASANGCELLARPLVPLGRALDLETGGLWKQGLEGRAKDPFEYVPTSLHHDADVALRGIITVQPTGVLRGITRHGRPVLLQDLVAA